MNSNNKFCEASHRKKQSRFKNGSSIVQPASNSQVSASVHHKCKRGWISYEFPKSGGYIRVQEVDMPDVVVQKNELKLPPISTAIAYKGMQEGNPTTAKEFNPRLLCSAAKWATDNIPGLGLPFRTKLFAKLSDSEVGETEPLFYGTNNCAFDDDLSARPLLNIQTPVSWMLFWYRFKNKD